MKKSLKASLLAAVAALMFSQPAHALFENGGFETGDLSGWDITYGQVTKYVSPTQDYSTAFQDIQWNGYGGSAGIWTSSSTMSGQTTDINPYNGNYMARLNDSNGGYDATMISQTDQITQADIDDGATLWVNWGALLVEPSNPHNPGEVPNFGVNVTIDGNTTAYTANALAHGVDPAWTAAGNNGGTIWYNHGSWSFDLTSLGAAAGDNVTVQLWVTDCGWGGHGGYAFLDGIGTTYQPPDDVPEPTTMLLMGTGLAGLVAARRRKTA